MLPDMSAFMGAKTAVPKQSEEEDSQRMWLTAEGKQTTNEHRIEEIRRWTWHCVRLCVVISGNQICNHTKHSFISVSHEEGKGLTILIIAGKMWRNLRDKRWKRSFLWSLCDNVLNYWYFLASHSCSHTKDWTNSFSAPAWWTTYLEFVLFFNVHKIFNITNLLNL